MRVFGYYLAHSFKNSIRKIFRTWVAIYIVFIILMAVVGGLIGYSVRPETAWSHWQEFAPALR